MAVYIWLLIGTTFCLTEFFIPTAFVLFAMGISAFAVAVLSPIILGKLWLQAVVWLAMSTVLTVLSRRLVPKRHRQLKINDAVVGETLTDILPGEPGRVIYEGNSWRARCDDEKLYISANKEVYVVRREGTTLIVMPTSSLY
jgi:membrane protein implicated in regulation of membrane protease activity